MTQDEFNYIEKELLGITNDSYYTEGDLVILANKYNLEFTGDIFGSNKTKELNDRINRN